MDKYDPVKIDKNNYLKEIGQGISAFFIIPFVYLPAIALGLMKEEKEIKKTSKLEKKLADFSNN